MVHEYLLFIIILLLAVLMLVMLGQRLRIAYPIFLVIAGLLISLMPGTPRIQIDPELVFLIFLPPILYEAAWHTSWHDFWKWRRPIVLLAFGLVFFTSTVIAYVSASLIPGFTLALGFLLGGIISPPDAVAATSVLKGEKIPKRVMTILEGESLVNDASSLIVFKFALAAIVTRQFVLQQAVTDFFVVAIMGILTGLAVALVIYVIHRFLPTTPSIDTALTLLTPYIMYITAEHFHFSGVMAVVSGGLFLSYRSHTILTHHSRIQATGVWSTLIFLINGTIFILIGLELPIAVGSLDDSALTQGIKYGLIISLLIIGIRFVWTYVAAFLPRILFKSIRERETSPGWKGPFVVSYAAMRGVVSLAAAFSLPHLLPSGEAFPQRGFILLITFVVILVTLVGQGMTLPLILRFFDIQEIDNIAPEQEQEAMIQLRLKKAALTCLEDEYKSDLEKNELVRNLKKQLEADVALTIEKLGSFDCDITDIRQYHHIVSRLIHVKRSELIRLRAEKTFEDGMLRKHSFQLDLDEARFGELAVH